MHVKVLKMKQKTIRKATNITYSFYKVIDQRYTFVFVYEGPANSIMLNNDNENILFKLFLEDIEQSTEFTITSDIIIGKHTEIHNKKVKFCLLYFPTNEKLSEN